LYLIPLTTALVGCYQSLSIWSSRKKQFDRLSLSRVVESGTAAGAQVGLNNLLESGGLILGNFVGKLTATLLLARVAFAGDRGAFLSVTWRSLGNNARHFSKFPKYSVGGALLDTTASQLPVLLIGRLFSASS